jgi:ATP/ADP translocase/HEAT repeat protein
MARLLQKALHIRPGEGGRVLAMFLLYAGIISCGFVVGRTVASSLFLHRLDKSLLPYTYVAVAIAMSLASALYSRLSRKVGRIGLFVTTLGVYAAGLLGLRGALEYWPESIIVVGTLYVFVDIMSILCITQFWTLACDVFTTREAKRVFGVVGGGSAVAMLVFGALLRAVVHAVGTPNLIFLMVAELVACIGIILWLQRSARDQLREAMLEGRTRRPSAGKAPREGLAADFGRLLRTRHLASIALITALMAVAITLIDYQWKMSARAAFLGDEDGLAGFFSLYNLFVGLASFFVQFFLTGRILEGMGILTALMLLPGALLAASGAVLIASARTVALWASTAAAGANALLRFTVQNTAVQLFFRPVAPDFRPRAEALVEGILKPVVTGLTGLAIAWSASHIELRQLSYPAMAILLLWLLANWRARRHYVQALAERIRSRRLDLGGSNLRADDATVRVLQEALSGDNEKDALSALELLRSVPERDWSDDVVQLLDRDSGVLRVAALRTLRGAGERRHAPRVVKALADPDVAVRSAAVEALSTLLGAEARDRLGPLLDDPEPSVAAAAAAALLRHCPPDTVHHAHERLSALAQSVVIPERIAAARALGFAGRGIRMDTLHVLLSDPSPEVRAEAGRAAATNGSAELLPKLVDLLADPRTARVATEALVSLKEASLGMLAETLANVTVSPLLRARIPRVLSDIGDQVCIEVLLDRMTISEPNVRAEIAAAAGRRLRRLQQTFADQALVAQLVDNEVADFFHWTRLQDGSEAPVESLLYDALEQKKAQCRRSLIQLLAIAHPEPEFAAVVQGFESHRAASWSDAIELLDSQLKGSQRADVLAVFDSASKEAQGEYARRQSVGASLATVPQYRAFLSDHDRWIGACTAHLIGELGLTELREDLLRHLEEGNGFMVQAALGGLRQLLSENEFTEVLSRFADDQRPLVGDYARALIARKTMFTVVEKVMLLKRVDIFRNIPGPVLSRIAEIAHEELFDEGATIMHQGDMGSGLYVVARGQARLTVDGLEVARLGESEFFGEMSLFDAEPTSATVTAATELDVLKVEPQDFSDLMAERVEIAHGLISVLIRRLRAANVKEH